MTNVPLKKTPLYDSHRTWGARMVPFAGYEMPVQYTGVLEEAIATRKTAGLFDVSHMGQFSLRGKNALSALNRLVTNDLEKLAVGQAQYNVLCKDNGNALDDLVIYHRAPDWVYICVNAANQEKDFSWMQEHLPDALSFEDEGEETALIALQGPKAEALLTECLGDSSAREMKYYWAQESKLFGKPCYLSRTGYTGEDGFELYVDRSDATPVWDELLERGKSVGLVPAGLGARDTLRLEMGYALYGHELSEDIHPLAANLGWVVKLQKTTPFIGQKALNQAKEKADYPLLKAFVVEDKRQARQGYPVLNENGESIGIITSGTFSPHLEAPVALGFVDRPFTRNDRFWVQVRKDKVPMRSVKLPFIPSNVKH